MCARVCPKIEYLYIIIRMYFIRILRGILCSLYSYVMVIRHIAHACRAPKCGRALCGFQCVISTHEKNARSYVHSTRTYVYRCMCMHRRGKNATNRAPRERDGARRVACRFPRPRPAECIDPQCTFAQQTSAHTRK